MIKRILIIFGVLILVLYGGTCSYFSSRVIEPPQKPLEDPRELVAKYGAFTDVAITTNDGLKLNGWLFENADSTDCGVIMVHGHGSNRYGMRHWMPYFWMKGCDVLLYDHRAHGDSEGTYGTFGVKESQDLLKVHEYFQKSTGLSNQQISWVGSSWGAATVLHAGPEVNDLAFILSDSPFKDLNAAVMERAIRDYGSWIKLLRPTIYALVKWRADFEPDQANTIARAKAIDIPVLLIHSQSDEATSSDQSEAIAAAMDPEVVTFHHTDWGSAHVKDVQNYPDRYWGLVDEFLEEQLVEWPR
ncbi:MAG: alpha/beta hydrolase [Cytophagales bacterium]|nr:alpha/beta hydrolase [Cytophagales bacterium]